MKKKQPDHCAHVAAYHVQRSNFWSSDIGAQVFGFWMPWENAFQPADSDAAVRYMQRALASTRTGIKFWHRAGGEVAA